MDIAQIVETLQTTKVHQVLDVDTCHALGAVCAHGLTRRLQDEAAQEEVRHQSDRQFEMLERAVAAEERMASALERICGYVADIAPT